MRGVRGLQWLAALAVVGGVAGGFLIRAGQVRSCVEFSGCQQDNLGARIAVVIAGFIVAGVLAAAASARQNRWRRDARYWAPSDTR